MIMTTTTDLHQLDAAGWTAVANFCVFAGSRLPARKVGHLVAERRWPEDVPFEEAFDLLRACRGRRPAARAWSALDIEWQYAGVLIGLAFAGGLDAEELAYVREQLGEPDAAA